MGGCSDAPRAVAAALQRKGMGVAWAVVVVALLRGGAAKAESTAANCSGAIAFVRSVQVSVRLRCRNALLPFGFKVSVGVLR